MGLWEKVKSSVSPTTGWANPMSYGFKAVDYASGQGASGQKSSDQFMSFIPGVGDAMAAAKQNSANRTAAQNQMDFQERMSNSAYQRATEDMKKAGINPMLAFSQGGASTPSGALPTVNSESATGLGQFAMNSALGMKGASTAAQQANTAQMQAEANIDLSKTTAAKQIAETERTRIESAKARKDLPAAELQGDLAHKGAKMIRSLFDTIQNSAKSSEQWKKALKPNPKIVKPLH